MNSKTVLELRNIAKDKCLRGYYELNKDDLVALLLEESAENAATTTKDYGNKRRPVLTVKIIPGLQEMGKFKNEEIIRSRPVIKNRLNVWYDWLIDNI